jgi:RNA polymerase sigma-70 factor (ECF subfamily)
MQIVKNIQADGAGALAVSAALLDHTVERVIAPLDGIVAAAQAGSPAAFGEIHSIYSGRLYQTILSITRNPHDAEEALQETFLRAYVAIKTFEGKSKIYTWLTRIAINCALMILRKQRIRTEVLFAPQPDERFETIAFEVKDSAPNPEELCILHQHRRRTLRAIRRLGPRLQAPIRMQIVRGWSIGEISRALHISESAVKSRLYRARLWLSAAHEPNAFVRSKKDLFAESVVRETGNPCEWVIPNDRWPTHHP